MKEQILDKLVQIQAFYMNNYKKYSKKAFNEIDKLFAEVYELLDNYKEG